MPPTKQKVKETDCQKEIIAFLEQVGCYVWRNNSGVAKTGGRFVRYGKPGSSDIIGISPNGLFVAVEVKSNGEPLTLEKNKGEDSQEYFLRRIADKGGISIIAESVADVVREYEKTRYLLPTKMKIS
jgi:hypothetical protein